MMSNTSADLWIDPTGPLGDVVEQSGPFGGVCGAIGADAKKSVSWVADFSRSTFWAKSLAQLRDPAHFRARASVGCIFPMSSIS